MSTTHPSQYTMGAGRFINITTALSHILPQTVTSHLRIKLIKRYFSLAEMENVVLEAKASWNHCMVMLKSNASVDLFIAFLEDFKVQFTELYKHIKVLGKTTYEKIANAFVDRAFVFWKKEGELTRLIAYVKKNWYKKEKLLKKMQSIDIAVNKIISYYLKQLKLHHS